MSGGPRRFRALVLAGSRGPSDPVAAASGLAQKCLVPAGGVPMLVRVLDALLACPEIDGVAVTLQNAQALAAEPAIAARLGPRVRLVEGDATPSLSVRAALAAMGEPFPVLVTTADHPLLTPEMIGEFCRRAAASGADVCAGLTASAVLLAAYPESRRTWLRFRDERYSGANLFALLTPGALQAVAFWRRVEQDRKQPWRIARAFGVGSLLAYALGLLTLDEALRRVSRVLGCEARAIALPFAEAAIDVDKPADLELVERILAKRAA
ncbi:MAG: NTP transferase domain-containing protein [Geminicoccaceae bacterium]